MAVEATAQGRKWVEQRRLKFLKLEATEKAEAAELAAYMQDVTVSFTRKVGEHSNLFGSVTAIDIAEKLASSGYNIDRRKVQLGSPIKVIGEYNVPVRLHREVTATIKVIVQPEGGLPQSAAEGVSGTTPAQGAPAPEAESSKSESPSSSS
jgi:large subunit ribosomal protein L9